MAVSTACVIWQHGPALPDERPRTLPALINYANSLSGAVTVIDDGKRRANWPDLLRWSACLAEQWAAHVAVGDTITIALPNSIAHLVAELACWRLAAIAVKAPADHGPASTLLVADHGASCWSSRAIEDLMQADAPASTDIWRPRPPEAPCLILYTSGSSGRAKGVILSEDTLCSQQSAYAMHWPDLGPGDRMCCYLPWSHSFGALAERLLGLCRGLHLRLVPGGGHDHDALERCLQEHQPTVFMSVPRMYRILCERDCLPSSLRWVFNAGAPMAAREDQWFRTRGIPVYEGWGLTETGPTATLTAAGEHRPLGSVGSPIAGVSVGVREDGQILIRGPNLMLGYLDDEVATAAVLQDACLNSGDLGYWQDGQLYLNGRADRMLQLENGEKVAAELLEEAIQSLPEIHQAVVFLHEGRLACILDSRSATEDLQNLLETKNQAEPQGWRRIRFAWSSIKTFTSCEGFLTKSHKPRPEIILRTLSRDPSAFTTVLPRTT